MTVAGRHRDLVASRRRRADEGEEDEAGSLDYESQSDASALTSVNDSIDGNMSETSGNRHVEHVNHESQVSAIKQHAARLSAGERTAAAGSGTPTTAPPMFRSTADVEAMANGLEPPSGTNDAEILQFDDGLIQTSSHELDHTQGGQTIRNQIRTHIRSSKSIGKSTTTTPQDNQRSTKRRGRDSSGFPHPGSPMQTGFLSTGERWNHDLHDLLESDIANKQAPPIVEDIPRRNLPNYCTSAKGPEPLSRTVTVGHITLRVAIPGMARPITYDKMPLKYHIRLPDLRPPLRRDKPVRVSVPYQSPRYIFPSVDRSFIFIPRAQRPNQQGGRRPFGSRRNSGFGGSSYTPSIAMSRRSSIARDGIISPAASALSKAPFGVPAAGPSRPVVKLPAGARASGSLHNGFTHNVSLMAPTDGVVEPMYPPPGKPAFQSQWNGQIPVHQPRPQKTVSVTNIESPHKERLYPPHQHEHQPFHHQVPTQVNNGQPQPQAAGNFPPNGTPSHLPDNAVSAQPFHPDQPSMYYSTPYSMQEMMYYPQTENATNSYTPQTMMPAPVYMQPTQHGSYLVPMLSPAPVPAMAPVVEAPQGTTAYEQNGTVYFYDASRYGNGGVNGAAYTTPGPSSAYPSAPINYYSPQP